MKKSFYLTIVAVLFLGFTANAQDTIRNKKGGGYLFTKVTNLDATPVQDQNSTGTCWSFSALSYFESELLRMGKGIQNLSEMYVVRQSYIDKADKYVRMHGHSNFGQGAVFGQGHGQVQGRLFLNPLPTKGKSIRPKNMLTVWV